MWSKDAQGMEMLKAMKVVVFGGASLAKDVGDSLIEKNVNLTQFYGAYVPYILSFHADRHHWLMKR